MRRRGITTKPVTSSSGSIKLLNRRKIRLLHVLCHSKAGRQAASGALPTTRIAESVALKFVDFVESARFACGQLGIALTSAIGRDA